MGRDFSMQSTCLSWTGGFAAAQEGILWPPLGTDADLGFPKKLEVFHLLLSWCVASCSVGQR